MKYQITRTSDKQVVEVGEVDLPIHLQQVIHHFDSSIIYPEVKRLWDSAGNEVAEMEIYEYTVAVSE